MDPFPASSALLPRRSDSVGSATVPKAVPRRADITVSLADSAPAWMELDDALERQELDKIELIRYFGREGKQEEMEEAI